MIQPVRKWIAGVHLKVRQLTYRGGASKDGKSEDAPMFQNSLLAHALGGYDGYRHCNTMAAFAHAVQNGYRYFEVDLSYTADDRLVLCHGWSEKSCALLGIPYSPAFEHMTYRDIMQKKIYGEPICDARTFYRGIKDLPYWFEIDFHSCRGEEVQKRVRSLMEDFENDEKLLDRLMIQVYSGQMYKDIEAVHHFRYYQYLIGGHMDHLDEILSFCLREGICAVAVRESCASPEVIGRIKSVGLHVLCYTVPDDAAYAKTLLEWGTDTVCTDFITPAQLESIRTGQE